jgi:hypothetical protein
MICFRDKTYCNSMCSEKCDDKLTDDIIRAARKANLPISICSNKCGKCKESAKEIK